MENAVRILMLEDRPEDAVLVKEELRRGGLRFTFERVETRKDFLQQIAHYKPDLILSDHGLPAFDGFSALRIAREKCPDIPFVFVTGALGEEFAIRTFENGASDYVLKHHLSDLVPAVERALRQAREMRAHRAHDDELQRNAELFRTLVNGVRDYAIYMLNPDGRIATWNSGATRLEGYTQEEAVGQTMDIVLPQEDLAQNKAQRIIETATREGRFEASGPNGLSAEEAMRRVERPILAVTIAGDSMAPPASTESLLAKVPRATIERWHYQPSPGSPEADHFRWAKDSPTIVARVVAFARAQRFADATSAR